MNRLGPDIFWTFRMKGHVFQRAHANKSQGVNFLLGMQKDDETGNKEWNSWYVMDVKMNTTGN